MTINEILSEFDIENSVFEMIDVSDALGNCSDDEKTSPEYQAELMAVNLVENYTDTSDTLNGKFYFGPYIVFQDQTTGKMIEYPDRTEVNSDMIKYWEKRVAETKNDILKARYSGLIWEFKFYATKQKCDIEIAQMYIQSLINIINNENQPHPILSIHRAERAIALSVKLKQTSLRDSAKNALSGLIVRNDEWDAIGIWGSAYKISTEYPNSYTKDEQRNLISDLETRFERIYEFIAANDNLQKDPWLLMDLANILAAYYQKNSRENIEPLFDKVENAFDIMKEHFTSMQLTEIYRRIHKSLITYGLNDKASQLCIKIAEYGNGIQKELFKTEHSVDIPNEEIKSIVNAILQDNNIENSLLRIACYFIPNKDRERCSLERIAKEAPFIHMITQSLYDNKGRLKAMVGGINTDLEGQLVLHISMSLRLEFIFLNAAIEEAKHRGFFTTENILNYISKSPVIKEEKVPIIKRGIEAYFSEDYLVAIHLIIPQIEEAIRNILDLNGIPIFKSNKSVTGFQLRILDDMLRDCNAVEKLTDDIANYFRILLTDNRGWNLRNEICHGIAGIDIFNKMTADRVMHALLCLGLFRLQIRENK